MINNFDDMKENTFLKELDNFLSFVYGYVNYVIFIISIFGVILNVFHLLVLFQKSMRQLTINIFLIGIAICDFSQMFSFLVILTPDFYKAYGPKTNVPDDCLPPQSYFEYRIIGIFTSVSSMSQKLAVWFGVSLATLRAAVVMYPTNASIQNYTSSQHGIRILLAVFLLNICYFIYEFTVPSTTVSEDYEVLPECANYTDKLTYEAYFTSFGELSYRISLLIDGIVFKLTPSILLPFFTIVLLYEMRKMRKVAAAQSFQTSKSKDRSTKLVTFVTITFLISTAPLGILYIAECIVLESFALLNFLDKIKSIFVLISIINGTLHFLICFFMSSQYRTVVINAIGWKSGNLNVAVNKPVCDFQRISKL